MRRRYRLPRVEDRKTAQLARERRRFLAGWNYARWVEAQIGIIRSQAQLSVKP